MLKHRLTSAVGIIAIK